MLALTPPLMLMQTQGVRQDMCTLRVLFDLNSVASDKAAPNHPFQNRHNSIDVLGGLNELNNERELSSRIYQRCGLHTGAPCKACDGPKHSSASQALLVQHAENLEMQGTMIPLVALVHIDRDFDSFLAHVHTALASTAPATIARNANRLLLRKFANARL